MDIFDDTIEDGGYIPSHPPRYLCDCLDEMRKILQNSESLCSYKSRKRILLSLTEEIQVYANRMEAGLTYTENLETLHKMRKKLIDEVKGLKREKKELSKKDKADTKGA